jgi:hypothetical protein
MNQEQLFGHKIRHALHQSTDELDAGIAARLHAARTAALDHQRQPVTLLSFAGLGHATTEFFRSTLAPSMLAFALVIGATGALYVDNIMQIDDVEELDSALLSDELPINAYLDDGFQVWVDSSLSASD